jgi:hypothetical protein
MLTLDSTKEEIDKASAVEVLELARNLLKEGKQVPIEVIVMALVKMENQILEIQSRLFRPKKLFKTNENGMAHFESEVIGLLTEDFVDFKQEDTDQIKNSFDKETKRKILNSLYLSLLSAGGAFTSALITGNSLKVSGIIAISTGGAFLVQAMRKYIEGTEQPLTLKPESR